MIVHYMWQHMLASFYRLNTAMIAVAACAVLVLSGCETTGTAVDPLTQKSYPTKYCKGKKVMLIPAAEYLMRAEVPVPPAPSDTGVSIKISLVNHRAWLYNDGVIAIVAPVCTGKLGHETPRGELYVVSKHREWESTIYHVPMPYLLRLSTPQQDIGIHQGIVALDPSSHGCIRLSADYARKFFEITPVGSKVIIED